MDSDEKYNNYLWDYRIFVSDGWRPSVGKIAKKLASLGELTGQLANLASKLADELIDLKERIAQLEKKPG